MSYSLLEVVKVGRTAYRMDDNKGRKRRSYLCRNGQWYAKENFPVMNSVEFNDSDWPKIFPEGTLLEDGYGCVYKVKNEKVERIWVPSSRALARIFG